VASAFVLAQTALPQSETETDVIQAGLPVISHLSSFINLRHTVADTISIIFLFNVLRPHLPTTEQKKIFIKIRD